MSKKRTAARKSSGTGLTLHSAVLAFLTVFAAGLTALNSGAFHSQQPPAPAVTRPPAAAAGSQFSACRENFPGGEPPPVQAVLPMALCFDAFAVLHSGESKTPVYVVERLTRDTIAAAQGIQRNDKFYPEARLPAAHRAQLDDYRGSGFDRGHMAPAGDMPSVSAKAQSFSLANMVPQAPELNQKAWNQIEQSTRKFAQRADGDVYVYTGPHFAGVPATIGPGKVWVPAATWKVVYVPSERRSWAYWMSNDAGPHSLKPIDYSAYRARGGPDVLPATASH